MKERGKFRLCMKYYADNMFLGLKNWPNVHDQY